MGRKHCDTTYLEPVFARDKQLYMVKSSMTFFNLLFDVAALKDRGNKDYETDDSMECEWGGGGGGGGGGINAVAKMEG